MTNLLCRLGFHHWGSNLYTTRECLRCRKNQYWDPDAKGAWHDEP